MSPGYWLRAMALNLEQCPNPTFKAYFPGDLRQVGSASLSLLENKDHTVSNLGACYKD